MKTNNKFCKYNSGNDLIKCAIAPTLPCYECKDYEHTKPKLTVDISTPDREREHILNALEGAKRDWFISFVVTGDLERLKESLNKPPNIIIKNLGYVLALAGEGYSFEFPVNSFDLFERYRFEAEYNYHIFFIAQNKTISKISLPCDISFEHSSCKINTGDKGILSLL